MISKVYRMLSKVYSKTIEKRTSEEKQVRQLTHVVTKLIERHYNRFPLPPESLRLNVGTSASPANWWSQGINSSTRIIQILGESPSGPILDWGCGGGRTLTWLQGYSGYRKHYHGCDVDKEAINWLGGLGYNVTSCRDVPPLPYEAQTFTGLFSFSVLTHIHPEKHHVWYQELWRVVKPGGKLYLTTLGPSKIDAIPTERREYFKAAGNIFLEKPGHYKSTAIRDE